MAKQTKLTPAMHAVCIRLLQMHLDHEISDGCDDMPDDVLSMASAMKVWKELLEEVNKDEDAGQWGSLREVPLSFLAQWYLDIIFAELTR